MNSQSIFSGHCRTYKVVSHKENPFPLFFWDATPFPYPQNQTNDQSKQKKPGTVHTSPRAPCHLPYDAEELGHGQLLGDQELSLVQRGQELLPGIALHYHLLGVSALKNVTQNSQYLRVLQQGDREWVFCSCCCYYFFFSSNRIVYPFSKSTMESYRDLVWELCPDSSHFLLSGCCEYFKYRRVRKRREQSVSFPFSVWQPRQLPENFT